MKYVSYSHKNIYKENFPMSLDWLEFENYIMMFTVFCLLNCAEFRSVCLDSLQRSLCLW